MPRRHVVKQGESLSLIALRYGWSNWRAVYEHPENAELRRKRPNPEVLWPGDEVVIPEPRVKEVRVGTGKTHRFTVKRPKRYVRLRLEDEQGQPLAGKAYTLEVEGQWMEGTTDGEGVLEAKVPVRADEAELECGGRRWWLALSELDPLEEVPVESATGVRARLSNLGYGVERTGGWDAKLRNALRAFQYQHGLEPTGRCDEPTKQKLKEVHGS